MLRRTHVLPFTAERGGRITVEFLAAPDGRVTTFLDRLCRLMTRLEGRPRSAVLEALRRQERRVRDARRLAGLSKTLLDDARLAPDPLADRAAGVRQTVFHVRGEHWPPVPGDEDVPCHAAADALGMTADRAPPDQNTVPDVATCSYIVSMRAIGIRELKNKLSHYVRLVEAGESVLVTHRGTVVAELRPPGPTTQPAAPAEGLAELVRRGRATAGAGHDPSLYRPRPSVLPPGRVRELLDAERGDRGDAAGPGESAG